MQFERIFNLIFELLLDHFAAINSDKFTAANAVNILLHLTVIVAFDSQADKYFLRYCAIVGIDHPQCLSRLQLGLQAE